MRLIDRCFAGEIFQSFLRCRNQAISRIYQTNELNRDLYNCYYMAYWLIYIAELVICLSSSYFHPMIGCSVSPASCYFFNYLACWVHWLSWFVPMCFDVFINSLYWNQIFEEISNILIMLMVFGIVLLLMSLSLTRWLLADCFVHLLINLFNIHVIYMYSWFNWVRVLNIGVFLSWLCGSLVALWLVLLLVGG